MSSDKQGTQQEKCKESFIIMYTKYICIIDSGTELNTSQNSNTGLQEGSYIYSIIVILIYKPYNVNFIQIHNLNIHLVNWLFMKLFLVIQSIQKEVCYIIHHSH